MKMIKGIAIGAACLVLMLNLSFASSVSTESLVKDGKKITTRVEIDSEGLTTTTVTTKEKDGTVKATKTVTDKDGNILSTDDPEARAKADAAAKVKKEKQAVLTNAPKRGPNDPIQMALFQTVVSDKLQKATTKEGVFPYLRKEFETDPVIKLLSQSKVDQYAKNYDYKTGKVASTFGAFDDGDKFLPADIYVESYADVQDKVGVSKATNKLATAPFLVYRAVIASEYSDMTWKVKAEGYVLNNLQVTKDFAKKIRAVVLGEAGAGIPAQADKFRRGGAAAGSSGSSVDTTEALRSLFKKKKK